MDANPEERGMKLKRLKNQGLESSQDEKRLYNDLCWIFPIITPLRHYIKETRNAFRLIRKWSEIPVKTILHLGCGGGHNDYVFRQYAQVTGVDLSSSMLKLASKLNPETVYCQGDMRTVRLNRTFDAVVAWDSMNHIQTTADLEKVFNTVHWHLKDGGVFLFLLDVNKEQFRQNITKSYSNRENGVEVVFIENMYDPDPNDTTYESLFLYLIRKKGKLTIETDHFLCGLYSNKTVLALLRKHGFKAHCMKYMPGPEAWENDGPTQQKYYPAFIAIKKHNKVKPGSR